VPDALLLLLLLLGQLSLADTAALGCACKAFRDCLAAAGHIWSQQHTRLLGGWAAAGLGCLTAALHVLQRKQWHCSSLCICFAKSPHVIIGEYGYFGQPLSRQHQRNTPSDNHWCSCR
jgi:hypothetical protein